jgi:hypothetical protein
MDIVNDRHVMRRSPLLSPEFRFQLSADELTGGVGLAQLERMDELLHENGRSATNIPEDWEALKVCSYLWKNPGSAMFTGCTEWWSQRR